MIGREMVRLWFRHVHGTVCGLQACQGERERKKDRKKERKKEREREREKCNGTSQDIKSWATSNNWNLELFIQHFSLTKQRSVQKNVALYSNRFFLNSALRSFIFGWRVLPLTKAYKFMTTSEAVTFFRDGSGCSIGGEEAMYRSCFFSTVGTPEKNVCFWDESDYILDSILIVSMIFCWCSLPTRGNKSRFDACLFLSGFWVQTPPTRRHESWVVFFPQGSPLPFFRRAGAEGCRGEPGSTRKLHEAEWLAGWLECSGSPRSLSLGLTHPMPGF